MSVDNMANGYNLTKEGADALLSLIDEDEDNLRDPMPNTTRHVHSFNFHSASGWVCYMCGLRPCPAV